MDSYDVIILGSDIYSLIFSAIISKMKKHKTILIQSSKNRDYKHNLKNYRDHILNKKLPIVIKGSFTKMIFDNLTDNKLEWEKVNSYKEIISYPDFQFELPKTEKEYEKFLIDNFPEERISIKEYFKDVKNISFWASGNFFREMFPNFIKRPIHLLSYKVKGKSLTNTERYVKHKFKDHFLRTLLTSLWGYEEIPPKNSYFISHAMELSYKFKTKYIAKNSFEEIKNILTSIIEKDGDIIIGDIDNIVIKDDTIKEVAIKGKDGKRKVFLSKKVITSLDIKRELKNSFELKKNYNNFVNNLDVFENRSKILNIFIKFKDISHFDIDIKRWLYSSYNHTEHYKNSEILNGKPSFCYFSTIGIDSSKIGKVSTIVDPKLYIRVVKSGNYSENLQKSIIIESIFKFMERFYPGFSSNIESFEIELPYINDYKNFIKKDINNVGFSKKWISVKTPIKNLYFTKRDLLSPKSISDIIIKMLKSGNLQDPLGILNFVKNIKK